MKRMLREMIAAALPRETFDWLRVRFGWRWFRGSFRSWEEARAASTGYNETAILARVVDATRRVRAAPRCWERDGMVFSHEEFNEPLLGVLREVARDNGRLGVIDFGGSLGSTWWQHRNGLGAVAVRWLVVEQAHYVDAGKEFEGGALGFCRSLEEAVERGRPQVPQVLLCSSALQYLEDPLGMLGRFVDMGFRHIILDRLPIARSNVTRLTVQHNPPGLGGGTYPIWLFNQRELKERMREYYSLKSDWLGFDRLSSEVEFRGWHFERHS